MNELALKYGCNPNQKPSRIYMEDGSDLPVTVLNGKPGYINFLDALNSIQLVKELKEACGLPAAASFKHVSPAGAALGLPLTDVERKMYHIAPDMELSPLACAYARARGADRMSSFGDWIALSDVCDVPTAKLIQHEVSDGIIAPGYEPEALTILAGKKKGNYNVVAIDPAYKPNPVEHKQVYGITFEQGRNELAINADTMLTNWVTENKNVTEEQKRDLIIALITLKYTQSNSVCYTAGGPAFQFFRDFDADCDWSEALAGEPGEFVVIVRRAGEKYFLGAATNEEAREVTVALDFLEKDKTYRAVIYADGKDADWVTNPTAYEIIEKQVTATDILSVNMAKGGGQAITFMPL